MATAENLVEPSILDKSCIVWYIIDMKIKTNITPRQLIRLNPWIKSVDHAKRIIADIKTRESISLDDIIKESQTSNNKRRTRK